MSSTKSIIGHCLGAAGCLEIISSILCARSGVLPSTANFNGQRDGCSIDCVPVPKTLWIGSRVFMSNSFAFGGNNVSVIADIQDGSRSVSSQKSALQKICITACEAVSPAGIGIEKLTDAVKQQRSYFSDITVKNSPASVLCAIVPEFCEQEIDRRLDLRNMDRPSRLSSAAAKLALKKAGFTDRPGSLSELGFYLSISNPPSKPENEHISALLKNDFHLTQVAAFPYVVPNSIAGNVTRAMGMNGQNTVLCGSKGSSLISLALAANAMETGHMNACVAGSGDEISDRIMAKALMPPVAAKPVIPGEGSVMFVLETEEHASARNVKPIAFIRGMAFSTDTNSLLMRNKSADNFRHLVENALNDAGVPGHDICAVCCEAADEFQIEIIRSVCGAGCSIVDCSPYIGTSECSLPLFNLAYAVASSNVETTARTNYILCSFLSDDGSGSVVVFELVQ